MCGDSYVAKERGNVVIRQTNIKQLLSLVVLAQHARHLGDDGSLTT